MPPQVTDFATWLALVLAAVSAIASEPGQTIDAHQLSQLLIQSTGPEAAALAGAIGERTDIAVPP
jgi:hypothetical protein